MMVEISIIMPAYNAEYTIGEAIDSALKQTLENFELLICDDASTDNTARIVKSFADIRIRLIQNNCNIGPGPSRDRLTDIAEGTWVALLDADDKFTPDRLRKMLTVAKAHPHAVVFDEIMECHDTLGDLVPWRTIRPLHQLGGSEQISCKVSLAQLLRCDRTMVQWVAPRQLIQDANLKHADIRFGEDLYFLLEMLARTNADLYYVPAAMYQYRLRKNSLTTASDRFDVLLQALKHGLDLFKDDEATFVAIQQKMHRVRHRRTYQQFFSAVSHVEAGTALRHALSHPWVVPEFFWRALMRLPYHVDRLRKHGARRGTS